MISNMSNTDRRVRAFLIAPAAVAAGILVGPGSLVSIVLYVVAAVMLGTSATAYCPLYSLLGRGLGRGRGHRGQPAH